MGARWDPSTTRGLGQLRVGCVCPPGQPRCGAPREQEGALHRKGRARAASGPQTPPTSSARRWDPRCCRPLSAGWEETLSTDCCDLAKRCSLWFYLTIQHLITRSLCAVAGVLPIPEGARVDLRQCRQLWDPRGGAWDVAQG